MRSYLIKIIILVFPFTIINGDDHDINVNGTVYRDGTKIPLQGANVLFIDQYGDEYGASTDANGKYAISSVPGGNYTVTISFIGYDDYQKSVLIESGKRYKIDAVLSIEPILMAQ